MVTVDPGGPAAAAVTGGTTPTESPVVLTGPPGAGKTTVGRVLADLLRWDFVDTDERIARRAGKTIPEIFLDHGEALFRELEREVVAAELAGSARVVALGGGAVMTPAIRDALAGHRVVFLDVGLREAVRRTGLDASRPLLALNPRATWLKLMKRRRPVYEEVGTIRVDTSQTSPADVAAQIVAEFALRAPTGDDRG